MTEQSEASAYLEKALESLAGAESEAAQGRYNHVAHRAYYAAFQAVLAALIRSGVAVSGRFFHTFVQRSFAGQLIRQQKLYEARFSRTLQELLELRHQAHYRPFLCQLAGALGPPPRPKALWGLFEIVWDRGICGTR